MSGPSSVRTRARRAVAGVPLAAAVVLGAAAGVPAAGAATTAATGTSGVVLTVPTALHHRYRHGAVPRKTRDVGGVEALGFAPTAPGGQARAGTRSPLQYGGGLPSGPLAGAGVTTGQPEVYLVFMGSQWGVQSSSGGTVTFAGDPDGIAPALQTFLSGIGTGGETWSGVLAQYCDGAPVGATTCTAGDTFVPRATGGVLAGIWYDNSSAATSQESAGLSGHQLASEAEAAATHFGNTDQASNRDTQYVIVSPTGTNPDGWADPRTGYCAYHDDTSDSSITGGGPVSGPTAAFTNLPYVPDAGTSCGAGSVNTPGTLDGATEAESHEFAETVTDQFPETTPVAGWTTPGGSENGDLCAYVSKGPGRAFNLVTAAGAVAVQGTWSNLAAACSDGEPSVTAVSPAVGAAGSTVTVSGIDLDTATAVRFGGVAGTIVTDLPGSVTATVPSGAVDGTVTVVTTYGAATSSTVFHVAPSVTSFGPTTTSRGGTLIIHGSGLGTLKKVVAGVRKAIITSATSTQVTVTVGPKAVSGSVTVTSKYGTSTLGGLTVS